MSPYPRLEQLRVGCVQYLNAKPLIYGYGGKVHFDHPAKLADLLARGALDLALVSTFEVLRKPDYLIVDGVSISARGEVYSVFLAYQGELKKVKTVALDAASLTGSNLVRCILAEYHGLRPEYVSSTVCGHPDAARLLIGNQAIDFRNDHGNRWHYLDLGAEWMKHTSLPFVFAAWLARPGTPDMALAAGELRQIKQRGVASIKEIVRAEMRYDATFETRYLTEHIRSDLG
ncbi:MAG TPA: menaquinone biosynthesis protein, partial [Chthoniobacteraceae bacterium]|nr:menaquinone biosynthesis protein [Chthoniobacteraceae bacterium]